jgi:hypothetical protein
MRRCGDAAMQDLRRAGFPFVLLPVPPELLTVPGVAAALADAAARPQLHGLAVVVALHPTNWHLETDPGDWPLLVAT